MPGRAGWRVLGLSAKLTLACGLLGVFCACRVAAAGDEVISLEVGGRTRTCIVHVPPGYSGERQVPVILLLHGGGGNAAQAQSSYRLDEVADRESFIVAYPNGTSRIGNLLTWNAANCCGYAWDNNVDDVEFISRLLDEIGTRYQIDPARIYVTGMSNGAMMAYRVGCRLADKVAAIAPVAGALNETECFPSSPVPAIIFHGTEDQHVLYHGGIGPKQTVPRHDQPVSHAVEFWVAQNGCEQTPVTETSESGNIITDRYLNGRSGAEVELITVVGGGHAWPGGEIPRMGADVPTQEISASELMWQFFSRHAKASSASPVVTVTTPNGGEKLRKGQTLTVTWSSEGSDAIASHEIWLSSDSGTTFNTRLASGLPSTDREYRWVIAPSIPKGKRFRVRVVAVTADGATAYDDSDADFQIKKRAARDR